jgi:glycosyltransferase involved in cell wall biosynthesis
VVAPQPFYEDRGTPIAVRHLVRSLLECGFSVDVLTYPMGLDIDVGDGHITRVAGFLRLRSVPVGFSWRKVVLDLFMAMRLRNLLRHYDYRAVHAVEEMAFAAVVLAGRHRVPVIYDMQSSLPDQMRANLLFRPAPIQRLLLRAERWLVGRADAVVCSAGLASYVRRIDAQAQVTEWKYPSAGSFEGPESPDLPPQEFRLPRGARIVMYTGTFATYQGLRILIDAMVEVVSFDAGAVLVLVGATHGRGPPQGANAARLAAGGHLVVVPRQPRARIPAFLGMAEILVSPRLYGDNVPLKIFDYLRAGKPIVATDTTGHRSVLSDDIAVLVERDAHSIAAGIIKLLADPAIARTMAGRARDHAVADEPFPALVSGLYARVLSEGAKTAPIPEPIGRDMEDAGP